MRFIALKELDSTEGTVQLRSKSRLEYNIYSRVLKLTRLLMISKQQN